MGKKKLSGNSFGGHSCSQHANCLLLQLDTSVALCCVSKLHILYWAFIVPNTRYTCVMIILFNQLLYIPPVRWMDYLGKGEMLSNRDVNKFVPRILEKYPFLCVWKISGVFLFQRMKHGANTLHIAFDIFVYIEVLFAVVTDNEHTLEH